MSKGYNKGYQKVSYQQTSNQQQDFNQGKMCDTPDDTVVSLNPKQGAWELSRLRCYFFLKCLKFVFSDFVISITVVFSEMFLFICFCWQHLQPFLLIPPILFIKILKCTSRLVKSRNNTTIVFCLFTCSTYNRYIFLFGFCGKQMKTSSQFF